MPWADNEMMKELQAAVPDIILKRVHYTLSSDFDKFMDIKYVFEPMPDEMIAEYNRMHEAAKPEILKTLKSIHTNRIESSDLLYT